MINGMVGGMVGGMIGGLLSSVATADPTLVLDLNFLASSLPAGLTFSRASAATDIINGVLTSFASGSPRISTANGYLSEQARTNLVLYNSSAAALGTLTGGQTDPAGASLAYLYTEGVGVNGWQWSTGSATISFVSGTTYTVSAFVKAGTCDRLQMFTSSSISGADGYANYYLNGAGSVSVLGAGYTSAAIQRLGSTDWYRISAVFTASGSASQTLDFTTLVTGSEARAASVLGTSRTLYWFGPQVEAAIGISSYIPTTTAAVTRLGDSLYRDISTLYSATAGTLLFDTYVNAASQNQHAGTINNTTQTNIIKVTPSSFSMNTGGVSQATHSFTGLTLPAVSKLAVAYASNDTRACLNGTLGTADTACTPPSGTMRLTIGADYRTSFEQLSGYVRRVRYWNVRKTDAELQEMTTEGYDYGFDGGFS